MRGLLSAGLFPRWPQYPGFGSGSPMWVAAFQALGPLSAAFPRPLSESWATSGVARIWTTAHIGCWSGRWQPLHMWGLDPIIKKKRTASCTEFKLSAWGACPGRLLPYSNLPIIKVAAKTGLDSLEQHTAPCMTPVKQTQYRRSYRFPDSSQNRQLRKAENNSLWKHCSVALKDD